MVTLCSLSSKYNRYVHAIPFAGGTESGATKGKREMCVCVCVCVLWCVCVVFTRDAPFALLSHIFASSVRLTRNSKEFKTSSVEAMFAVDSRRVLEPNRFYFLQ
jgi:hypothetical protein